MKRSLPGLIFVLATLIAFLHLSFLKLSIYWTSWWSDNLVHFLGGVLVACIGVWILYVAQKKVPASRRKSFLVIVALVMLVGIAWEIFEYKIGITGSTENYKLDTFHDLLADLGGGALGWLIATSKKFIYA